MKTSRRFAVNVATVLLLASVVLTGLSLYTALPEVEETHFGPSTGIVTLEIER